MTKVTVSPAKSILITLNTPKPSKVATSTLFIGSANVKSEVDLALNTANTALTVAQSAYNSANNLSSNVYSTFLQLSGGEITGNLKIDGSVTNNNATVDAGIF